MDREPIPQLEPLIEYIDEWRGSVAEVVSAPAGHPGNLTSGRPIRPASGVEFGIRFYSEESGSLR